MQPRQQVIDWFTHSATLYQQTAAPVHVGNPRTVIFLLSEARCFSKAAIELQSMQPRQQVVDWFTQSATLCQQAALAWQAGKSAAWFSLYSAAENLSEAAKEAQEPQPNQERINYRLRKARECKARAFSFCTII